MTRPVAPQPALHMSEVRHGPTPSPASGRRAFAHRGALAAMLCSPGARGRLTTDDAARTPPKGYDPKAAVTITWWTGQTAEAEKVAEKLADEYHAAHPNVTIKASPGAPTTDDLLTKLSAGFTGGSYPDISYAYGNWAGDLGPAARPRTSPRTSPTRRRRGPRCRRPPAPVATVDGKVIGVPALVDNLGADLQQEAVRRGRAGLPDRPVVLGRVPGRRPRS